MTLKGNKLVEVGFGRYVFEEDMSKRVSYQFDFKGLDSIDEREW